MQRLLFLLICFPFFSGFPQSVGYVDTVNHVNRYNHGEYLEFDLGFGWFTLGKADLEIADQLEVYNDTPCFKVEISGRTTGILGVVSKVNDSWGGYVDAGTGLPLYAYADLHEGKYQRKEDIFYDYENEEIRIDMVKRHKPRPTKFYPIEEELYDLISGYLKMRNLNYSGMSVGDTIEFRAFYDEIYYDFGVLYEGIEEVKTEVGKLKAYRVVPIIPENNIFPGENPITAWISADKSQLPLKVEADMFFGSAYVELTNYKNIKYGPDFNN
jgi:hypothetical protein